MVRADPYRRTSSLTWRIARLWLVVLAVGLAVIAIVLAIQQSRSFTARLMAQAHAEAGHFSNTARFHFELQVGDALRKVVAKLRAAPRKPWSPPDGLPGWLDGLFLVDRGTVTTLSPPSDRPDDVAGFVAMRISSNDTAFQATADKPSYLTGMFNDRPALLVCVPFSESGAADKLVAAWVNLARLKADFLDPLISPFEGLEVVPAGRTAEPWSQPLHAGLRHWAVKPTGAFIEELRSTVLSQTLIYLAITVLSLTVLLVAMGILTRVVRRDIALAEMKANFVADVSHELKTPLALISMFSETLQSGRVDSDEKRQEYYEIITRESSRLTNLIDNILDFARIDALRKSYTLEPTDIGHVVRDTFEVYSPQLDHSGFEHHLSIEPNLPIVEADRGAIARVLINLINNALKYSTDERYVAVDVTRDTRRGGPGVLISVHDRGIGIKPEDRARLFDGFFRASDPRVREQGGTGLGLGLVKHIVDGHHGSIDVESRLVKGSTFRIFLPAMSQAEAPGADAGADAPDLSETGRRSMSNR